MVYKPPHLSDETAAVYAILKQEAREIAARLPLPDFYREHADDLGCARHYLDHDPLLTELRGFVAEQLEDDFGHGIMHALKVAADAGALSLIEGRRAGYSETRIQRIIIVCQTAGLLHDIHRKHKNHAVEGARYAREALTAFAFNRDEIDEISYAIRNHEAFQRIKAPPSVAAGFLSDCLYDADKFRWGPDNFTDTLWDMVAFFNPSVADFVRRYPGGMQRLEEIKTTFRSHTGKKYGPQMIDFGIIIGRELMTVILTEFNHMLA
jgi:HD domain